MSFNKVEICNVDTFLPPSEREGDRHAVEGASEYLCCIYALMT